MASSAKRILSMLARNATQGFGFTASEVQRPVVARWIGQRAQLGVARGSCRSVAACHRSVWYRPTM